MLDVVDDVEDGFDLHLDFLRHLRGAVLLLHALVELAENELGQAFDKGTILLVLVLQGLHKDDLELLYLVQLVEHTLQHQVQERNSGLAELAGIREVNHLEEVHRYVFVRHEEAAEAS